MNRACHITSSTIASGQRRVSLYTLMYKKCKAELVTRIYFKWLLFYELAGYFTAIPVKYQGIYARPQPGQIQPVNSVPERHDRPSCHVKYLHEYAC